MGRLRAVYDPFANILGRDAPRIELRIGRSEPCQEVLYVVSIIPYRERRVPFYGRKILQKLLYHEANIV